jgi:N-acyl-D-amino-acid deacylase
MMHVRACAALLLCAALTALTACSAAYEPYDVIIRNGTIVDGSGGAPYIADIGIRGERITAIGPLPRAPAKRVIDAAGLHVAPGFIDVHSHAGGALATERLSTAHALLAQGVTTVVINPDGGGAIDQAAQRAALLEHGLGVNVAQLVPHGAIRGRVLGSSERDPTADELERMRGYVRAGMEEGAFGLSSGLFYTPGIWSTTEEVIALAEVTASYGGVYSSHIRDEADYNIGVVAAVDEVIRIAREAGVTGVVSHVKALGPNVWGTSEQVVASIEAARAAGVDVWADQYAYDASATGFVAALVPAWAREGDALQQRLAEPATAARIRAGMAENLARRGGGARIMLRGSGPLAGRTLADIAAERGVSELDAAVQLVQAGNAPGIISFNMHEDDITRYMRQPWMMTSSDGGLSIPGDGVPHPRNYGAFARKIRLYVVEQQVIGLPAAVRSMSSLAAEVFGMQDRGVIRHGAIADLVIFDLPAVNDPATFDAPHQLSEGMVHVLVNGTLAIDGGSFTDALAGQVLHRRGAAHAFRRDGAATPVAGGGDEAAAAVSDG